MKKFDHRNIIKLLGSEVVEDKNLIYILMKYHPYPDLNEYIIK